MLSGLGAVPLWTGTLSCVEAALMPVSAENCEFCSRIFKLPMFSLKYLFMSLISCFKLLIELLSVLISDAIFLLFISRSTSTCFCTKYDSRLLSCIIPMLILIMEIFFYELNHDLVSCKAISLKRL